MIYDVECPYCEHQFDVCDDDGMHCDQDAYEEEACPECDKISMISTSWYPHRTATKADCLNSDSPQDSDHNWGGRYISGFINGKLVPTKQRVCSSCEITKDTEVM